MPQDNGKMNKKWRFKPLPFKVYLLYFVVATLIFTGVTLSRYSAEITSTDSARVAVAVAQMTGAGVANDRLDANVEGDNYRYMLTVSNTNGDFTAEVTLDYTFHVIIKGPHPALTVSMPADEGYRGAKCNGQYDVTIEASDSDTELLFVPNDTLPAGVEQDNHHVLTLKPFGEKSECMKFKISVWAEIDQVD